MNDIRNCVAEAQLAAGEVVEPVKESNMKNGVDMKIGLISINMYSKGLNFACPLHNWAFQEFLNQYGIKSTIIDYTPNYYDNFDLRQPTDYYAKKVIDWEKKYKNAVESGKEEAAQLAKQKIMEHTRLRDSYKKYYHERASRYDKFQDFIESHYVKTPEKYDSALLEVKDPGFDCYICVTDAIWKKEPYYGYDPGFFLASTCMENKWKISYAASTYFTKNEKDIQLTEAWINDIDYVSVREKFLAEQLQNSVRSDVTHVLDPVLLHTADFYEQFLVKPQEENYVLLYYVMSQNPEVVQKALNYAKAHNLILVELSDQASENELVQKSGIKVVYKYDIGVEEWLGYIKYADCVFTNSFHASCFSLLFERVIFAERRSYDKVGALLDMVGLSQQIIENQDFSKNDLPEIDWTLVKQKLDKKRAQSEVFILGSIYAAAHKKREKRDYLVIKAKQEFPMFYNIGRPARSLENNVSPFYNKGMGKMFVRPRSIEFLPVQSHIKNDGSTLFHENVFKIDGFKFIGWRLRIKVENRNFLMLKNGTFIEREEYDQNVHGACKIFEPGEPIPMLNLNNIKNCVAEGQWIAEK